MAGSYVLPQVKIFQQFSQTPNDVRQQLNPFVFGPQFSLTRYSNSDERSDCATKAYAGNSVVIDYVNVDGAPPDPSYAAIDMEDVYCEIPLKTTAGTPSFTALGAVDGFASMFQSSLSVVDSYVRGITAGDYIAYTSGGATKYSKVRAVGIGTPDTGEITITNPPNSGITLAQSTGGYTGEKRGNLTVHISGTTVWWSSSIPGVSSISSSKPKQVSDYATAVDIGSGLTLKLTSPAAGDYTVSLAISARATVDTVTLCDSIPEGAANIRPCVLVQHVSVPFVTEDGTEYLELVDTGVKLAADIKVNVDGIGLAKIIGATAYLTQRNRVMTSTDAVHSISSITSISEYLGVVHPDNPLAYGVYMAKLNSADIPVYYMATAGDELSDWSYVLDKSTNTSDVYAFCPMTSSRDVINLVQGHINERSSATEKQWRIGFVSIGYEPIVERTPSGDGANAPTLQFKFTTGNDYITATCYIGTTNGVSDVSRFVDTLRPNDKIRVLTGGLRRDGSKAYDEYTIIEVVDNAHLRLSTKYITSAGVAAVYNTAGTSADKKAFQAYHTYTHAESATAIADASAGFYDHRMYNVWPGVVYSAGLKIPGYMVAAAVAGLACSVQPQQPITNVEITGVTDIPQTHSDYSREELNTIASGGTLIVMQDMPGSTVYIRHQISTRYREGNLNTTELSLTKNLDSISYYFANRFAPYIGRYNVTEDLISNLRAVLESGISYLSSMTVIDPLIGPQIIAEGTEIVRLMQHPEAKDTVYATVNLNLPAPFNNFELTLYVI